MPRYSLGCENVRSCAYICINQLIPEAAYLKESCLVGLAQSGWISRKGFKMVGAAWVGGSHAYAACSEQDLPKGQSIPVFPSLKNYQLYEEDKNDSSIYGVRIVGAEGDAVPVAAVDLATHSLWFRAYLRNR